MVAATFLDFDVLVVPREGAYHARVLRSPVGEAQTEFELPFTAEELRRFTWLSGRTLRRLRPKASGAAPPLSVQAFGSRLYGAVFGGEVGVCLVRSLDRAEEAGEGLRINLRLNDAPELADLPWEYLYATGPHEGFLALSGETPIVRYLELPVGAGALKVLPPLCILAVVADPHDVPRLDVEREWRLLHDALDGLQSRGQVRLERLEQATVGALQAWLRKPGAAAHILHFIGHGEYDADREAGGLYFEKPDRTHHFVPADDLAMLLADHQTLRLVFLNACEGARGGEQNLFAGAAQTLVRQGVPAVLAMQFPVSDGAAMALAQEFYRALAEGLAVDAAAGEARKAVKAAGNDLEWGTPVLFSRSPDNRILVLPEGDARPVIDRQPWEPETVLIPGGPFLMGSAPADGIPEHETPQHEVTLPDYRIGKFPVMNCEYEAFLRAAGWLASPEMRWDGQSPFKGDERKPVSGVTWCDAIAYCNWLSEQTGRRYTLPTEAHWEKAARGADGRRYPWGDAWEQGRAHQGQSQRAAVDCYPAQSEQGCFDMVGNAPEWTCSLWGQNVVEPDARYRYPWQPDARNSLAANSQVRRIVRGGAASDPPEKLRCAARTSYLPLQPGPFGKRHGFRVMMLLHEPDPGEPFCSSENQR